MSKKRSIALGGMTNLNVLAPIKPGMVIGFEPVSYLERLRKVLDALQSARQNVRESEMHPPVFPDSVGRFGIIENFRYSIVPPSTEAGGSALSGTWRLSLNVTFDGGWEPYMRVIYRDLGTLLDLLFCHCVGYPGSLASRFEDYCAWVRSYEIEGGLFYTDSALTLGDQHYLARVESAQRDAGNAPATDLAIARLQVPSEAQAKRDALAQAMKNPIVALTLPMRTLKGLYRLSVYFPPGVEMDILKRFTRSILEGPIGVMTALDGLPATTPGVAKWTETKLLFADELAWLNAHAGAAVPQEPDPPLDPAALQSHLLGSDERMSHGCAVLLSITYADRALTQFATLAGLCGPVPSGGTGYVIAFTYAGLNAIRVAPERLDKLPQEFLEGMEARCSLLGDARGNHPDRWTRPLAYGPGGGNHRVDMKAVHVVVHLRLADDSVSSPDLHPKLQKAIDDLSGPLTGLRVLAVQPTRSYRDAASAQTTGHLGFADGISQPSIAPASAPKPTAFSDAVSPGELLVGRRNDRGDSGNPTLDPLQFDGSFLVMRKLRQRVDNLDSAISKLTPSQQNEVLAKMVGRNRDGTPLTPLPASATGPNDFDYATPAANDACPIHSHVRRANPRDGRPYLPRILRRGMSYGPKSETDRSTERGVVFMAYCASIAEQFEVLQRWIAGGNSSGGGSAQADPMLRVPQPGESSTFRYLDANHQVVRVVFDDKPLVQLEWGLYLFVPTLSALRRLAEFRQAPAVKKEGPPARPKETPAQKEARLEEEEREAMRQRLDDPDHARQEWLNVRQGGTKGCPVTAYGRLVGRFPDVMAVLKDKDASEYSVQGYGERMSHSIGLNLLGMDPGTARSKQLALNHAILAIDARAAFDMTAPIVAKVLAGFPNLPADPGDIVRRPIDLVSFSDFVLAALCSVWIGLPEAHPKGDVFMVAGGRLEENPPIPRCPGNFATASRYIFSPQPRDDVKTAGQQQGGAVREAVEKWLKSHPTLGTLADRIKQGLGSGVADESVALSLAGVLLGFPPTVHGNFIRTMETWIKSEALWLHQQALFDVPMAANDDPAGFVQAEQALRAPLLATMRERPVPEMLWRSPVVGKTVDKSDKARVVLGITSALTDPAAPNELMFGRDRDDASEPTVHGCPGYQMAMGVMLAMLAGLMKAGTLRPTGSPVLLILTPN